MNEFGIDIQLLYPNLVGFASAALIPLGDEVSSDIVRAYNDFIWEWSEADRRRLIPTAMLPFWNIEASVDEMHRCVDLGFKGILFANKFERLGLPSFVSSHWDPIYSTAQDLDVSVNYHVGFGDLEEMMSEEDVEATHRPRRGATKVRYGNRWHVDDAGQCSRYAPHQRTL